MTQFALIIVMVLLGCSSMGKNRRKYFTCGVCYCPRNNFTMKFLMSRLYRKALRPFPRSRKSNHYQFLLLLLAGDVELNPGPGSDSNVKLQTLENHLSKLEKTCRTCGNKIKVDKKYPYPKPCLLYAHEIQHLFDHDVSQDTPSVHPSSICSSCRRQLDRCSLALKSGCVPSTTSSLPLFMEHNAPCLFCSQALPSKHSMSITIGHDLEKFIEHQTAQEEPATVKRSIFNHGVINDIAKKLGFICEEPHATDYKAFIRIHFDHEGNHVLYLSVRIYKDFTWNVYLYGHIAVGESNFLSNISPVLDAISAKKLFLVLKDARICPGNPDFPTHIQAKLKVDPSELQFFSRDGNSITAHIETSNMVDIADCATIRAVECHKFLMENESRCNSCQRFRKVLQSSQPSMQNLTVVSPSTRHGYMSLKQLEAKLGRLQEDRRYLIRSNQRLEAKISSIVSQNSMKLHEDDQHLCSVIAKQNDSGFPEGSPQDLLWRQQKQQASYSNSRSMRWHPLMIRWCLSLYLKSPGAYEQIRSSGFLQLPHRTTLNQYSNFTSPSSGFHPDIIGRFIADVKLEELESYQKNVALAFDEMKIKSGLVFSKASGKLVGFSDLGEINNELMEFERITKGEQNHRPFASHILTLMVRGIFIHCNFPIAYFPANGFTSDQLYPCVWEGTRILEMLGFSVRCFVCDGASPNRRFFRLHQAPDKENVSDDGVVFWTWNKYSMEQRKIYFVCDVPHLIKTIRNNWENSHGHNNTRHLMIDGKEISWQHLIRLYEWDLGMDRAAPGLRKMPKLTEDHIRLNPRSRMQVFFAAQVLSKTVADTLDMQARSSNSGHTEATQQFVRMVDRFFDCLNGSDTTKWRRKRKEDLMEYRSTNDPRLQWLQNHFLKYINDWKAEANQVPGVTKDFKNRLCLSLQTIEGIRITVRTFVALCGDLLSIEGVQYVLPDKLNQDPLEEHFGRQRMRGGANENPTVAEYGYNELKIIVCKSGLIKSVRGNLKGRDPIPEQSMLIDQDVQLPKRKKRKKNED